MTYVSAKGLSGVTTAPMARMASAYHGMFRRGHRYAPIYTSTKTGRLSRVGHSQFEKCCISLASKKKAGPNSHTSHTSHTHGVTRPYQPRPSCIAMHRVESGAARNFNASPRHTW